MKRTSAVLLFLLIALRSSGQQTAGSLSGVVFDSNGTPISGVSVVLTGPAGGGTASTDSDGVFRFLNLKPGSFHLSAMKGKFPPAAIDRIQVKAGATTRLRVVLDSDNSRPSSVEEEFEPAPAGEEFFDRGRLDTVATTRDPWAVLELVPGVLLDFMNVDGSRSGQQRFITGRGTDASQNAWILDGVTITDRAALGASPAYFDFDSFEQVRVTTGGVDPEISVPGVTIDMVTRHGTNSLHGSLRFFETPHSLEGNNAPAELERQNRELGQPAPRKPIDRIDDYGVEAGGPVWPGRAWLWGSYGRQQIDLVTAFGASDRTRLENFGGKLDVQPFDSNQARLFYFRGEKSRFGIDSGPTRPQPTTLDQKGPTTVWKGEDTQLFGRDFVANVSYSYTDAGFRLTPEGGLATDAVRDADGIWRGSYQSYSTFRPQHELKAGATKFFRTGSLSHELKFGFVYRKAEVKSASAWPGSGNWADEKVYFPGDLGGFTQEANITGSRHVASRLFSRSAFLGDTITANDLTVNAGLRYDSQSGSNLPSHSLANTVFPELLGDRYYAGGVGPEFRWKNFEPRLGATYALGSDRSTLLHASYGRFADQLGSTVVTFDNPNTEISYIVYRWGDANGNHEVEPGELGRFVRANIDVYGLGWDSVFRRIDPNLRAPTTDEISFGGDQRITTGLTASATYTYRQRKNLIFSPYTQLDASSYSACGSTEGFDINGQRIGSGDLFCANTPDDFSGARIERNRPSFKTVYQSLELRVRKERENGWAGEAWLTLSDWKQRIGDKKHACIDPTNGVPVSLYDSEGGNSCADGDIAYSWRPQESGGRENPSVNAKWSFDVAVLRDLPYGMRAAAHLYGRQGYPIPYFMVVDPGDGLGARAVAIGSADSRRTPSVFDLGLGLLKTVSLGRGAELTFHADLFNVFNSSTVLQRSANATETLPGRGDANRILDYQSPRVLRLGARLSL